MKYAYFSLRPLLAALFLLCAGGADAQMAWRPFRPGLIYAYRAAPTTGNGECYTLRVDSAYATAGGDSVYAFNRRLRVSTALPPLQGSVKSRNNLFGALLQWRPGQAGYTLEALAQANVQPAASLELLPQAAVGSTWTASSQPLRTATLVSRSWQTVSPGVQDTVAVINITSPATTMRLSRRYGLIAGPQWLGGAVGVQMEQALLPATFEQSIYSPLRLFDVQPGDEFGYEEFDLGITPIQCGNDKTLRRIVGRRLTADSLVVTYREQKRHEEFGYVGPCFLPAQVAYSAIAVKRWALARAGNSWQSSGAQLPFAVLRLLTGEYAAAPGPVPAPGSSSHLLVGRPVSGGGVGGCAAGFLVSYTPYYPRNSAPGSAVPIYATGLDYAAWQYGFRSGLTTTVEYWNGMIYSRKQVNGAIVVCGSPQAFVNLLPTRAAQAAAVASLFPNPAAEAATLALAVPARPGTRLVLRDALGRRLWQAPVPAGRMEAAVPLAGRPAGLYLLQVQRPEAASVTLRLVKE